MLKEIFIDIGHGGTDAGAVKGKLLEKNMNLVTGLSCKAELERHNVKVHMSRTKDTNLSLQARTDMANNTNASACVSIHHNAGEHFARTSMKIEA